MPSADYGEADPAPAPVVAPPVKPPAAEAEALVAAAPEVEAEEEALRVHVLATPVDEAAKQ